jgi:site-specific DNA-methyltransferase (adenine-specific)
MVQWLTEPGDVVYDPFCGRGTTVLEACLARRVGLGSDLNPIALVVSGAKVLPPASRTMQHRLNEVQREIRALPTGEEPDHIKMLFSEKTLGQLLWLRENLDVSRKADRLIMAILLGSLHANAAADGTPRGLTVAMPNTFSMSPGYVAKYIRSHRLEPPNVDVVSFVRRKHSLMAMLPNDFLPGRVWQQDASKRIRGAVVDRQAKLVLCSPPYLEVMKYGKMNWIRLWLLGETVSDVDASLFTTSSTDRYLTFMARVVQRLSTIVRDDGIVCLVVGDVQRGEDRVNLASLIQERCLAGTELKPLACLEDRIEVSKKVSRIWGKRKGNATRTDRLLILGGAAAELPEAPSRMDWQRSMSSKAIV